MKGKIIADIIRQERERKKYQKEDFEMIYDDPKEVSFIDENINLDDYRAFHKDIFSYNLSKPALAIYPVLCSETDFEKDKTFQIPQKEIKEWAGISESSVRKGIEELENVGVLHREKITERIRHYYIYKINFIRKAELNANKGKIIYFYTCLIRNGIWAKISLPAKILYLILRTEAKQDWKEYAYIEGEEYDGDFQGLNHTKYIQTRKWDICHLSLMEMSKKANVDRGSINKILEELEAATLAERIGKWTKIYLKPQRFRKY